MILSLKKIFRNLLVFIYFLEYKKEEIQSKFIFGKM